MSRDTSYQAVMARRSEIVRRALGIDFDRFELGGVAFDYEGLMESTGYTLERIHQVQRAVKVGDTPLYELANITRLVRSTAAPGHGARIFVKDEAANASGSFKARRASLSVHEAARAGYPGVAAATSGNYGAAVVSQATMAGLRAIIVQEVFDSRGAGQPEIVEKARKCEALGAEVLMLTVGPELFYTMLCVLEETGFFNASLYTPYSVAGIESLGYELVQQCEQRVGRQPDAVIVTHAGGGNVTGTARGVRKAGADQTLIIGASVDLSGLHMASDRDFNRKSFTTGHTGFGVPFATWPDRSDVPRSAARPLRYLDRYLTVTQGEVFYTTEMLAAAEGIERGPAGNTSLAAAVAIAREMDSEQIVVVQETEYTGAGKHPTAQLTFARQNGVEVRRGDPRENKPGEAIVIPTHHGQIQAVEVPLDRLRLTYLKNIKKQAEGREMSPGEWGYLSEEINQPEARVRELFAQA
ncbi:MAG: PLP-dependent lyase/thiolase [Bradymonadales bacterium]|nr:PLP-dependent lyase/thiolase [Bradymonadales bacterium]